jgi:hypothetical protein
MWTQLKRKFRTAEDAFREWLYLPNTKPLRAVMATILASRLPGVEPPWTFLVGGSGSGKTELIRAFDHPSCIHVSTLTPRALVSGWRDGQGTDPSLLPKLDNHVLCVKDFTSIMSLPPNDRLQVLADLRDAFDGSCSKSFGSQGLVEYKAKFGLVAGVTGQIDVHNTVIGQWGERFIKCRMPSGFEEKYVEASMLNVGYLNEMRTHLKEVTIECLGEGLKQLESLKDNDATYPPEMNQRVTKLLLRLAFVTAKLRSEVPRNAMTGEISYIADPEVGTRLVQQLSALYVAATRLTSEKDAIALIRYIARSSPTSRRLIVCRRLWQTFKEAATLQTLAQGTVLNAMTIRAELDCLHSLGVVESAKEKGVPGGGKLYWRLTQRMHKAMHAGGYWHE